jgi:predicted glycoside hydrolase/deacetylase ChbG (UPF0249 family)
MTFTPCSPRHKSCSPAHAALVESYRQERWRQEVQLEAVTNGYTADYEHWKAKGGKLITLSDWLKAHKHSHRTAA